MEQEGLLANGTLLRGGTYQVERALSSGGFGNTYVVKNLNFGVMCAMKEFFIRGINTRDGNLVSVSISQNRSSFDIQRDKFKKEALRLWHLKNNHIVRVHDLFEENETVYYVMDLIDGESLADRQKRLGRPLTESEVMPLFMQALDALDAVHQQQIWHLDIKPANMMVDRQEQLFIIDFGASKQLHTNDGHSVATSSALAYTPGFAPLEQTDQNFRAFGPWTDIYALGASLYKLLTNETPPTASEIIGMGNDLPFPPYVTPRMQQLITWMMKPAYAKRPKSINEIRSFLNNNIGVQMTGQTTKPIDEETVVLNSAPQIHPTVSTQQASTSSPQNNTNYEHLFDDESDNSKKKWLLLGIVVMAVLCLGGCMALGISFLKQNNSGKGNDVAIDKTEVVEETNGAQGDNQSIEKAYSSSEQSTTIGYDKPSVRETNGRHYLQGSVDKYPITMEIDIDGSSVSGSYYYNKNGSNARLYLSGSYIDGTINLNEVDANGTPTGHFQGSFSDGHFNGVFTTNQGKQMYFQVFE